MDGLMSKKMRPEESATPASGRPAAPSPEDAEAPAAADPKGRGANPPDEGGEPATPQEEQAMASVLNAAMTVIYSDQSHEKIMATLQQAGRPDAALADVAAGLMLEIDQQAQGRVPETVILPATMAIIALLAELATAAGLFQADDTVLAMAAQQATMTLMQEYGANPQDVQALIQQIGPDQVKAMVAEQQQMAQQWAGGQPGAQPPQPQQPQQPPMEGV